MLVSGVPGKDGKKRDSILSWTKGKPWNMVFSFYHKEKGKKRDKSTAAGWRRGGGK